MGRGWPAYLPRPAPCAPARDRSCAHTRRKFYDVAEAENTPLAHEALRRIASLYAIEAEVRGQSPAHRLAARRARSRPLIDAMHAWLGSELPMLPARGAFAEAIRYALARWDELTRFLADGRVDLDTNPVERAIRPITLGRKNTLFAGSDGGGERWAVIASMIETAKLNGVEPFAWLKDVLARPVNAAGPSYAALTRDMLYDFLKSYQLPRDPGETFEYSNLGSGLLGYILATHEGVDYDTLVHRRVLDPLHMTRSGVGLTADMQKGMTIGHGPDGLVADKQLEDNWRMPRLEGAGDLHATMNDLLKFVAANLGPPDTPLKQAMQEAQNPRVPRPQGGMLGLDWNRYSIGDGPEIVFHAGAMPGYGAWLGFDPKRRVGVVLLQNTAFAANDIPFHLLDPAAPLAPAAEPRDEISVPAEQLAKYAGLNAWDGLPNVDKFRVTIENGHLTTQAGVRPKEAIFAESSTMFFFRSSDARIIFTTDTAGAATGLILRRDGKDEMAKRVE